MSVLRSAALVVSLGSLAVGSAAAADNPQVTIKDGLVTIVADNVPVRRILEEWAKVGQSRIVNADRLTGAPVTLRLVAVPEVEALRVLLRSAAGYVAAPRPDQAPGASRFDRILILATSRAPAGTPPPSAAPQPFVPQPMPPNADDQQAEPEEGGGGDVVPPGVGQPPTFLQPNPAPFPGTGPTSSDQQAPAQSAPLTAPRPGMIAAPQGGTASPQGGYSPVPGALPSTTSPGTAGSTGTAAPPKKGGGGE